MAPAQHQQATKSDVVSSESECLILVDSEDREVGSLDKAACHDGEGVLHRAFSLFIFNDAGELLLQRRAADKRLWPNFWSNSCCSHPRQGEDMPVAVARRLEQELGLACELEYLYKFEYQAAFPPFGSENELCWVYSGHTNDEPVVNVTEISEWQWIAPQRLTTALSERPDEFTPWFALEWSRLQRDHAHLTGG